jgi:hypothetical protein
VKKTPATSDETRYLHGGQKELLRHSEEPNSRDRNVEDIPAENLEKLRDLIRQRGPNRAAHSSRGTVGAEPVFWSEPLTTYRYDRGLGRREEVVLTVKTTLQREKNERQAERMSSPNPEVSGREAARPYLLGIVAAFSLSHDRFDWGLAEAKWAFSAVEPYGVDARGSKMALATANCVRLINLDTGEAKSCQNPWLNQAHTVEFSADGEKLLVSAAGFDAVFEFATETGELLWQWFAWDHGFDRSKLGHFVVRSAERCKELVATGQEVLLVNDPTQYAFGVPTRRKPAHLNSAGYDTDGRILVTFFHQGAGYVVDRETGEAREVIAGLSNPHKLSRRKGEGYFISDTRRGRIIFLDENHRSKYEITFAGMPGVERAPELSEFLQNTTELRKDLFACIDIHRSSLWLIDVKRRRYRAIKFPTEWSVHDVASLEREHEYRIGSLVGTHFGKIAAFARLLKVIHHFSVDGREVTALALRPDRTEGGLGLRS